MCSLLQQPCWGCRLAGRSCIWKTIEELHIRLVLIELVYDQPKPIWFSIGLAWYVSFFAILSSCLLCPFSVHILTSVFHKIVHLYGLSFCILFLHSLVWTPALSFSSITSSFSRCLYYLLCPLPPFHPFSLFKGRSNLRQTCDVSVSQPFRSGLFPLIIGFHFSVIQCY